MRTEETSATPSRGRAFGHCLPLRIEDLGFEHDVYDDASHCALLTQSCVRAVSHYLDRAKRTGHTKICARRVAPRMGVRYPILRKGTPIRAS